MSNTAALVGAFTAGAGAAALVMTLRGRCCSGGAASSSTAAGGAGGASDGSGTSTGRQPGEKIRFGYWAIRGLAQSVRYLLEYAGVPYQDDRYTLRKKEDGSWSRHEWMDVKHTLGLEFPNLPYMIDGDMRLTQSNAIVRYVARMANLLGQTEVERTDVDVLLEEAMDFRNGIIRVAYAKGDAYDEKLAAWRESSGFRLSRFEERVKARDWMVGSLTAVDFVLYELTDQAKLMYGPEAFESKYPCLCAWQKRFEELPQIKRYQASDKCIVHPINNLTATFL